MNIRITEIPEEGLVVNSVVPLRDMESEADVSLRLTRMATDVFISGIVESDVPLECSRCLRDFRVNISVPVEMTYSCEIPVEEEEELDEDDLVRGFLDEEIDLDQIVEEQVLLNLPMKPLCQDKCKGLCPRCGADLNSAECGCTESRIDPRLKDLEKLLNKRRVE